MTDEDRKQAVLEINSKLEVLQRRARVRDHFHAGVMACLDAVRTQGSREAQARAISEAQDRYAEKNA